MRQVLAMITAISLVGAGHALAEEGVTAGEITIGNVLPMSGPAALVGTASDLGSRIAASEANAAGGVNGRKIRIVTEDDGYVPSRAYQGLAKLVNDGVFGIIGTSGAASLAAMLPMVEEKKIPLIVTSSVSKAAVEPPRANIFMVGAPYEHLFFAQLKYIHERDKPQGPYAMIRQDDDYGALVEEGFKRAVSQFKLPAAEVIRFKRGQKEFGAEILKLREQQIGALAIGGVVAEIPAVLKELAKYKMSIPVATPHTGNIDIAAKLSASYGLSYYAADYVATIGSDRAARFRDLAKRFLAEDQISKLNRFSLTAYVGTRVMIEAARACGSTVTRECVVNKIKTTQGFDTLGLTKPLNFGAPNNTAGTSVQIVKIDPAKGSMTEVTEFLDY